MVAYGKVGEGELPWALFQGKKLRKAGEGSDELSEWLDIFSPAGSTASYTLCVYHEDTAPESITPSTPSVACWDFKLNEYSGGAGGSGAVGGLQKRLEDHVAGIMKERLEKLEKKMEDDEEDEPGFDLNKVIMGWLQNPEQLVPVIGMIRNIFARGSAAAAVAPAAIGAFNPPAQPQSEEEQYQRLAAVLERLQVDNPDIVKQLEKLADIKEKKPDTFKFLISNLNGI